MPVLLNTAYFPPVSYFALMARDMKANEKGYLMTIISVLSIISIGVVAMILV